MEFEREKARIKREIETGTNKASKGGAKDKLAKLKEDWHTAKEKFKHTIKTLRRS